MHSPDPKKPPGWALLTLWAIGLLMFACGCIMMYLVIEEGYTNVLFYSAAGLSILGGALALRAFHTGEL